MFKILMDDDLAKQNAELHRENKRLAYLEEKVKNLDEEKERYAKDRIGDLREKMQKSLTESDIEREKLKTKVEMYEKMLEKFNFNLNKEVK